MGYIAIELLAAKVGKDRVAKLPLMSPVVIVLQEGKVLTLLIAAWHRRDFWPRRVFGCTFAVEFLSDLCFSNPNMHFATSSGESEESAVLVGPFFHRFPRRNCIYSMHTA